MNYFLTSLIFFLILSAKAQASQNLTDNFMVHLPLYLTKTIVAPLEIFDNKGLQGTPLYIVDNKIITDLSNVKKEYIFQDYYKKINPGEHQEDKPDYNIIKPFPIDFVKISMLGYVIPIESKDEDILKILGKNLYFKVTSKNIKGELSDVIEWRYDQRLAAVKALMNEDEEFKKFMNDLSTCVKKRSRDCLFTLSSGFKDAATEWTLYHDEEICEKVRKAGIYDDSIFTEEIKKIKDYIINWPLYEKFVELKNNYFYVLQTTTDFGQKYRLDFSLSGDSAKCGGDSKMGITYIKEKGKKPLMILSLMTGEGG